MRALFHRQVAVHTGDPRDALKVKEQELKLGFEDMKEKCTLGYDCAPWDSIVAISQGISLTNASCGTYLKQVKVWALLNWKLEEHTIWSLL